MQPTVAPARPTPPPPPATLARGDVVMVQFTFTDQTGTKRRPALVVQTDRITQYSDDVILAAITSKTAHAASEPAQLLIPQSLPEWGQTGLRIDSVVKCEKLLTLHTRLVERRIGSLPDRVMLQVNDCLREALGLPANA